MQNQPSGKENVFISLIVPMKNECSCVEELFARVRNVFDKKFKGRWEILMIDDGSTDSSLDAINRLAKKYPEIRPFHHKKSRGQAGCFDTGFNNAFGEYCITMDGDLQVMPEDVPLFISRIEEGYELINGIRTARKHPFWIKVASRLYNLAMLILFNCPVLDAASNFTAVRTNYIKGVHLKGNDHRYVVPIAMTRGAKNITEVAIRHNARSSGRSKYSAFPKYIKGPFEIIVFWIKFRVLNTYGKVRSKRNQQ